MLCGGAIVAPNLLYLQIVAASACGLLSVVFSAYPGQKVRLVALVIQPRQCKAWFKTCGFSFTMQGGLAGLRPAKKSFLFRGLEARRRFQTTKKEILQGRLRRP